MKTSFWRIRVIWSFVAGLLAAHSAAYSQTPMNRVKAAMQRRANEAIGWEIRMESVRVQLPVDDSDDSEEPPTKESEMEEETPYTIEGTDRLVLDLQQGAFRLESRAPTIFENKLYPDFEILLGHGNEVYVLKPEPSQTGSRHTSLVDNARRWAMGYLTQRSPIFWELGQMSISDFLDKTHVDYEKLQGHWTEEGNLIHWRFTTKRVNYHFIFDSTLDYRIVSSVRSHPPTQLGSAVGDVVGDIVTSKMEYSRNADTFRLQRWETSMPPFFHETFTVSEMTPLSKTNADDFRVPPDFLQPGMRITKGGKAFTVNEDLGLTTFRPGHAPASPVQWKPFVLLIVVFIAFGVLWKKWWLPRVKGD